MQKIGEHTHPEKKGPTKYFYCTYTGTNTSKASELSKNSWWYQWAFKATRTATEAET